MSERLRLANSLLGNGPYADNIQWQWVRDLCAQLRADDATIASLRAEIERLERIAVAYDDRLPHDGAEMKRENLQRANELDLKLDEWDRYIAYVDTMERPNGVRDFAWEVMRKTALQDLRDQREVTAKELEGLT